ncbi:hypothetical protein L6164_006295 [Bauhinia variegata]|uniref:Uncharacterized protein n=1 Tax=Bauhinia variegata TaxID=167791 RepID=A0ACB9PTE7_BAUVA|nr:hypothetical protein L6164_006295 [Bauhinia variegata]
MKTALLALSLSLFAFAIIVDAIHDTDGDPVLNGAGRYHILPVFRGNGGGLTLARAGNETCPRTVVQAHSQLSNGLPDIAEDSSVGGGSVEVAGNERFLGKFKIKEQFQVSESGYKLVYCPRWSYTCKDLGIAIDENKNRRLVARDGNPLFVQFKKAGQISQEWSIIA